ncbi:hypothetical protein C8Q80DRAFT_1272145 [Daedaleopsis nitida]|nr:hypothetical protein C8Q80DRAFT_1272145 [Daedaleopsis nitida]
MLSALPATHHSLFDDPTRSYNRHTSSFFSSSPAMQGKHTAVSKARPFIASPNAMFRVYSYTPQEGAAGTTIVVTVQFSFLSTETTFLRVVVGNRALSTAVRPSTTKREGEWDLEAVIPDFAAAASSPFPSSTVSLTVQALDSFNTTLDSVTFGKFTYIGRRGAPSPLLLCKRDADEFGAGPSSGPSTPDLRSPGMPSPSSLTSRKTSRPIAGSSARGRAINASSTMRDGQMARGQPKKQSMIRARRSGSDDDDADNSYRAILSLETPTETMAKVNDWDEEERRLGRRLVRFTRVQDGCTLHVVCEAIQPSDYVDGDTVVSCIHRSSDATGSADQPTSDCCITSVDIIFLLECLVGDIFNIEEKNRIRRNLEGFRPKTVSKNKAGTEEFFQKIMDFPAPKPRNIEKDVKVFDWAVLPQALDKIISKYTLYPTVKKQDGGATPPIVDAMGTPPHLSQSLSGPYSASSSPDPDSGSDASYFYPHHTYSRSHYMGGSIDPLDSNYVGASALTSAGGYDNFISRHHPASATSSPSPLLSTPSDSPMSTHSMPLSYPPGGEQYIEPLFQPSYPNQSAFGSGSVYSSYDDSEFQQRLKMASSADMHHGYL